MRILIHSLGPEEVGHYNIIYTRSMQGMFGASVSELRLLIKSLINIERAVDLCVITKNTQRTQEL